MDTASINDFSCEEFSDAEIFTEDCGEDACTSVADALHKKRGQRKTGCAFRREMRRKNLQKCKQRCGYGKYYGAPYPNHAYVDGEYVMVGDYLKRKKDSNAKVFYKRVANRKVRRCKEEFSKGNGHRKLFDYWWMIY